MEMNLKKALSIITMTFARLTLAVYVCLLVHHASTTIHAQSRSSQPNFVILLADDLGWRDLKCYDIDDLTVFETPYLYELATKGVKFWQAYAPSPVCSPSRGAILTGKHPARLQRMTLVGGAPPEPSSADDRIMAPYYSVIRTQRWKLLKHYDWSNNAALEPNSLYKMYGGGNVRQDIEESNDLFVSDPTKVSSMNVVLESWLASVGASLPPYDAECTVELDNEDLVPLITFTGITNGVAWVDFQANNAQVISVALLYSFDASAEWFTLPVTLSAGRAEATLPSGATEHLFNLIDENGFLISSAADGITLVQIRKLNALDYCLNGGSNGANAQNVRLWSCMNGHPNLTWEEIDRGDGYYSYQKQGTDFSLRWRSRWS